MIKENFENLYSNKAGAYVKFRPQYPRELFEFIAGCAVERGLVWDCGTGNGQAAVALAEFFASVIATDASAAQIEHALPHTKIKYSVATAACSPLPDRSCDAVTAANATHWFDVPQFFAEARRVLKPGGIMAIWCYDFLPLNHDVAKALEWLKQVTNEYGPAPVQLVWQHYKTLEFPFHEIAAPEFDATVSWNRDQFMGFASTWSTVDYCRNKTDRNLLAELNQHLAAIPADEQFDMVFRHYMRIGRA